MDGTRGLSAKALLESKWIKSLAFLRFSDWHFQPSDVTIKSILKTFDPDKVPTETKYQETTANTTNIASNALTLEWQK